MATERTTERDDGVTRERITEHGGGDRPVVVERGGGGFGVGLAAVLAVIVIALIAVFVINQNRQGEVRTAAVSDAAETVGDAATTAATGVADAADRAADSVAR